MFGHVTYELFRNLTKNLLCQETDVTLKIFIGNELNNIAISYLSVAIDQIIVISVENVHVCEICVADSHDDNTEWKFSTLNNLVNSLAHVVDATIGQNE